MEVLEPNAHLARHLCGQIPVVTKKFNDHEIESTALLWDGTSSAAERFWVEATMGRQELVDRHLASVAEYNRKAVYNNTAVDRALAQLG